MKDKSFRRTSLVSLILCACIVVISCSSDHSTDQIAKSSRQKTIDALSSLPRAKGPCRDPNDFFSVLNHLSMESGYVLDYEYEEYDNGGLGRLYARKIDGPQHLDYLAHIQIDDTEEGFFQFMVFCTIGNLCVIWHAAYDYQLSIICDAAELGDFGNFPSDLKAKVQQIDFAPKVDIQETQFSVRIVVFNPWKGFSERNYTFTRDFPHRMLDGTEQILLRCNVGPTL